jgi:hypothetical protein
VVIVGLASGRVTNEMVKHPSYLLWSKGWAKYQYTHLECFTRDRNFRRQFIGKPVEALHSGATYSPDSYRRQNVAGF